VGGGRHRRGGGRRRLGAGLPEERVDRDVGLSDREQSGDRGAGLPALDLADQAGGDPDLPGEVGDPHAALGALRGDPPGDAVRRVAGTRRAGWILPPGYPNFSTTTIEFVGSEAALLIDDSHRDIVLNRMDGGVVFPLSTMLGERVGHVYAGPMAAETEHFLAAVAHDRPVLVPAAQAREVMQVYLAADESVETGAPVRLGPDRRPAVSLATAEPGRAGS
jgi:predicted dehydrogenase